MKLRFGMIVVGCLLAGAGFAPDKASDWKELTGDWQPTKMWIDGNELPPDDVKEFLVTLAEGKYTAKRGSDVIDEGKVVIDASKSPKYMDLTATVGDNKDKVRLGIYELKGDTMKFAFAAAEKDRPTKFESAAGSGSIYIEYKKKK